MWPHSQLGTCTACFGPFLNGSESCLKPFHAWRTESIENTFHLLHNWIEKTAEVVEYMTQIIKIIAIFMFAIFDEKSANDYSYRSWQHWQQKQNQIFFIIKKEYIYDLNWDRISKICGQL